MFRTHPFQYHRGRRAILDGVALDIVPGEVLSVLGANGAGKSTLLGVFAAELFGKSLSADQAVVTLNGESTANMPTLYQAQCRAVLPQKPSLSFDLMVKEVVEMGGYPFSTISAEVLAPMVNLAMAYANLSRFAERRYLGLSGGEQQRVHFARMVLQILAARKQEPDHGVYLLLDEPTASLDPKAGRELLAVTRRLASELHAGVLVIMHDVNLSALWSDRIALLHEGQLLALGAPSVVLTKQNLKTVYDVNVTVMPHPDHSKTPLVVFSR